MKRILFYGIVLAQIILITLLVIQFERIETKGKEIQLLTQNSGYDYDGDWIFDGTTYIEYDISRISKEIIDDGSQDFGYNEIVYVLLERSSDGSYGAKRASKEKIKAEQENEVVLVGHIDYTNEDEPFIQVWYDFSKVKDIKQYGEFKNSDTLRVTLYIGDYGQYKITAIEKVSE